MPTEYADQQFEGIGSFDSPQRVDCGATIAYALIEDYAALVRAVQQYIPDIDPTVPSPKAPPRGRDPAGSKGTRPVTDEDGSTTDKPIPANERVTLRCVACVIESCDFTAIDDSTGSRTTVSEENRLIEPNVVFNPGFYGTNAALARPLRSHFGGDALFDGAHFGGDARFDGAHFGADARFGGAHFGGVALFGGAHFGGVAWFAEAHFGGDARFGGAHFGGDAWFAGAHFGGAALFDGAHFGGDARFDGAHFGGAALFAGAHFGGDAWFAGAHFGGAVLFGGAHFGGAARFAGAHFGGAAWFDDVTVIRTLDLSEVKTWQPGRVSFVSLRVAADGEVKLAVEVLEQRARRDAWPRELAEEWFLDQFIALCWFARPFMRRLFDIRPYGPFLQGSDSTESAKLYSAATQYETLRNAFRKQPSTDEHEDVCHFLAMTCRRRAKWAEAMELRKEHGWLSGKWLEKGSGWFFDWAILNRSMGYMIRSRRILLTGTLVIAAFASVYLIRSFFNGGEPWIVYTGEMVHEATRGWGASPLFNALYISMVTFTTLGYGDFAPVGFGRLLAASEALLGAALIALYTVSWARKVLR